MALKLYIIFLGFTAAVSRRIPFYRRDYTYFEEFDAFYKFHWESVGVSWDFVAYACEKEDSMLFYPKSPMEWTVVKNLTADLPPLNTSDIFVGIQNEGIEEFLTIDGLTTPFPIEDKEIFSNDKLCTTMDIDTGVIKVNACFDEELAPKPFVCKKVQPITCPTIDNEYKYYKDTKKCYKVSNHDNTWHEALHTCIMEGGILAVIENDLEANIINKNIQSNEIYHVGFRRTHPSQEYYTIKGQHLHKVYNRFYNDLNEECGNVNGQNNPLYIASGPCNARRKFICEITVEA